MKPFALDSSMTTMGGVFYPTGHVFVMFPTHDAAQKAAQALQDGGVEDNDISLVTPEMIQEKIARTVGKALVQHYGARPEWGAMNYTVHELVEQEESGETKATILHHLRTADDRRAAEAAMREMHQRLEVYVDSLTRRHLGG